MQETLQEDSRVSEEEHRVLLAAAYELQHTLFTGSLSSDKQRLLDV